jgi:hypothetical protein
MDEIEVPGIVYGAKQALELFRIAMNQQKIGDHESDLPGDEGMADR